jgi:hypothetical protein
MMRACLHGDVHRGDPLSHNRFVDSTGAPGSPRDRTARKSLLNRTAAPVEEFRSEPSALVVVAAAWWGHFRYIVVAAAIVTLMLYSVMHAIKAKCSQGLTRDVFELHGQTEVRSPYHLRKYPHVVVRCAAHVGNSIINVRPPPSYVRSE